MRQNGIPPVYLHHWPIEANINYDINKSLTWCPWGTFKSDNIHCYTEDYRFEITWRKPELTLKRVLDLNLVIAPDFTVYPDAPPMINRWQIYRSISVFAYWQNMGVNVIPSINWTSPGQIQKDIDLYPKFSTISVRCPGKEYLNDWLRGAIKIKKVMRPKTVLHFGTALGIDVWDGCEVFNYSLRPKT